MRNGLLVGLTLFLVAVPGIGRGAVRDPDIAPRIQALFDTPFSTARTILAPSAKYPNGPGVVRCFYFPDFTIKELDYGDHGDTAMSATPANSPARPRCGKQDDAGEKLLADGQGSYFLGAKGGFAFVSSTFGGDGLGPFFIYDGSSGRRLLAGVATTDSPRSVSVENDVLHLSFRSGVRGSCSLVADGAACWRRIAQEGKLPAAIGSRPLPLASCEAAYAAVPRGQDFDRKNPSVVYYEVSLTLDRTGRASSVYGQLSCGYGE